MQRLPVEAWIAILCITAGPLDDLDEMTGAEGDVSSWRTCLCVEIVSKVPAARASMHCSDASLPSASIADPCLEDET